jgi:hypothetical protein
VFPARYKLNSYIVCRKRLVSKRLNQFRLASRLVCSFCEAIAGSLSMATTAVSSAKVAVVDSDEVGRSAVCSRYNNVPRTLPWGKPALTKENSASYPLQPDF